MSHAFTGQIYLHSIVVHLNLDSVLLVKSGTTIMWGQMATARSVCCLWLLCASSLASGTSWLQDNTPMLPNVVQV